MAIDTPATIAIIGAGPLGLEAALYASYLGYDVRLFDRGEVAARVLLWGDEQMLAPFGDSASKLGLAALHAQDSRWRPPSASAVLTGREWREVYLLPLAQSDLLVDALREHSEVMSARQTPAGGACDADESPALSDDSRAADEPLADDESTDNAKSVADDESLEPNFELRLRSSSGDATEEIVTCHLVIDASGPKAVGPSLRCGASPDERLGGNAVAGSHVPLSRADGQMVHDLQRRPIAGATVTSRGPNFYLLGDAARHSNEPPVAFVDGLHQIRAIFAVIGGRESLDLYATMDQLLP